MTSYKDDYSRIEARQLQELANPIRLGILMVFARDRRRPLTAKALHQMLIKTAAFRHLKIKQVGYHVACLQEVDLLPRTARR